MIRLSDRDTGLIARLLARIAAIPSADIRTRELARKARLMAGKLASKLKKQK